MTLRHLPSQAQSQNPFQQAALFRTTTVASPRQNAPQVLLGQNHSVGDHFERQQGLDGLPDLIPGLINSAQAQGTRDDSTDGLLQALSTPARKRDAIPLLAQARVDDNGLLATDKPRADKITAMYRDRDRVRDTRQLRPAEQPVFSAGQREPLPPSYGNNMSPTQTLSWLSRAKEVILDLFFEPVPMATLTQGAGAAFNGSHSGEAQSVIVSAKSDKQKPIGLAQLTRYTFVSGVNSSRSE
ncbi:MAG: hypothetical protein VKJ04_10085 [Vampirovibrionales bacterium]|nr:hypothetical protein [Vampirovibrionales bacterium]